LASISNFYYSANFLDYSASFSYLFFNASKKLNFAGYGLGGSGLGISLSSSEAPLIDLRGSSSIDS
jgi:hypothetical protein